MCRHWNIVIYLSIYLIFELHISLREGEILTTKIMTSRGKKWQANTFLKEQCTAAKTEGPAMNLCSQGEYECSTYLLLGRRARRQGKSLSSQLQQSLYQHQVHQTSLLEYNYFKIKRDLPNNRFGKTTWWVILDSRKGKIKNLKV